MSSDRDARTRTTQIQQVPADSRAQAGVNQDLSPRAADEAIAAEEKALDAQQEQARKTPAQERAEARSKAPGHLLLLLLIFLICYLIAAATGRPDIISFPRTFDEGQQGDLGPSFDPNANGAGDLVAQNPSGPGQRYDVAPMFSQFYANQNGTRILGRPISDLTTFNGRQVQWFERARLEHWPEFEGTKYEVQPGRVGAEYTQNMPFPNQSFTVSSTDMYYSPRTNHAVRGELYRFWLQYGGVDVFGHPISDELQELLPVTGQVHTVQYFERARLEYHPENAGTEDEIMIGLLGKELYLNDSAPNVVSAAKPTPVPVPVPAQ